MKKKRNTAEQPHVQYGKCEYCKLADGRPGDLVWDDVYDEWFCWYCARRPAVETPGEGLSVDDDEAARIASAVIVRALRDLNDPDARIRETAEQFLEDSSIIKAILSVVKAQGLTETEFWSKMKEKSQEH